MTINVRLHPMTLCDLLEGQFTYEACEAICQCFEDCGITEAVSLGDIAISFCEIPESWHEDIEEYEAEGRVIARLKNGNVVVMN